jgi:hypothetical protein
MKAKFHIGAPIIVFGAAVVAAVLLATTPWSGEEAAGGTVEYRFCDLVFEAPPPGQGNLRVDADYFVPGEPRLEIALIGSESRATLNREGRIISEYYVDEQAQERVATIVASKRPAPARPAWWPYSDLTQYEPPSFDGVRVPDAGSGLAVSIIYGDGFDRSSKTLELSGCASEKQVTWYSDRTEPEVTVDNVQPEDQEAFDTFFATADLQP